MQSVLIYIKTAQKVFSMGRYGQVTDQQSARAPASESSPQSQLWRPLGQEATPCKTYVRESLPLAAFAFLPVSSFPPS
jgi:hypothetical protein